jgi:hypothetical protein
MYAAHTAIKKANVARKLGSIRVSGIEGAPSTSNSKCFPCAWSSERLRKEAISPAAAAITGKQDPTLPKGMVREDVMDNINAL